ncbi:DNA-directed RNA polymerase subunit omega [Deltaproteobacteria bacterium TL4]
MKQEYVELTDGHIECTRFEKVIVAAKRAKYIYDNEEEHVYSRRVHKPSYQSIVEINAGLIEVDRTAQIEAKEALAAEAEAEVTEEDFDDELDL